MRHTQTYRSSEELRGKRVLIIGAGNSGADIACDAARTAARAFLSVRRGYHFIPKHIFGKPADVFAAESPPMPRWLEQRVFGVLLRLLNGDLSRLGLPRPDHRIFETHPILNTQVLHFLSHGDLEGHARRRAVRREDRALQGREHRGDRPRAVRDRLRLGHPLRAGGPVPVEGAPARPLPGHVQPREPPALRDGLPRDQQRRLPDVRRHGGPHRPRHRRARRGWRGGAGGRHDDQRRPARPDRRHPLHRHRPPRDLRRRPGVPEAPPPHAPATRLARVPSRRLRPAPGVAGRAEAAA